MTGPAGEKARIAGLRMLTYAAMYDAKTSKGVGIQLSKDGQCFQIDWSRIDLPWAPDPQMEAMLAKMNPFRPAEEKIIDSFFLRGKAGPPSS